jgi:hypothetical protein
MNRIRVIALALVAAAGLTCKDQGPDDRPGGTPTSLLVTLATPNADDGAIMLTVRGPGMQAVTSASPAYLVFSNLGVPGQARVIAVGDLRAGAVFTVAISGTHALSKYSVTLDQVASRSDSLRSALAGYKAELFAGGN